MAGRSDKIEQCVDTIIAETGVTLDTRLLRKNIIVLSFEITDNLSEAMNLSVLKHLFNVFPAYLASLSI
jgi:hypothetical protein